MYGFIFPLWVLVKCDLFDDVGFFGMKCYLECVIEGKWTYLFFHVHLNIFGLL